VGALRCFPHTVLTRIAATITHFDPTLRPTDVCNLLELPPFTKTYRRAAQVLDDGEDAMEVFQKKGRGVGLHREDIVSSVVAFFVENSIPANTGRFTKPRPKGGQECEVQPHRVLQDTLTNLWQSYRELHGHISFGRFAQIRRMHTRHIRLVHQNSPSHSGCRYCMDFRFLLDALARSRSRVNCSCPPFPRYDSDIAKFLLCERGRDPWWSFIPCVVGECKSCGFKARCNLCLEEKSDNTLIEWSAWAEVETEGAKKYTVWEVTDQKPVTATVLFDKAKYFCDVMCVGGKSWLRHLVTARVQHEARRELLSGLKNSDVYVGVDWSRQYEFSEPFVIAQSSFSSRKANILVIYTARLASRSFAVLEDYDEDEDCGDSEQLRDSNIEYETFFFVSTAKSDGLLHHGLNAVLKAVKFGIRDGGTHRVFLQSDGEFRNRHNFAWLGMTAKKNTADMFWSFYAANHGDRGPTK